MLEATQQAAVREAATGAVIYVELLASLRGLSELADFVMQRPSVIADAGMDTPSFPLAALWSGLFCFMAPSLPLQSPGTRKGIDQWLHLRRPCIPLTPPTLPGPAVWPAAR